MSEVWSSGLWRVKEARGAEFAAAWKEFADWSAATHGPAHAWLLRDRERPNEFVSIGPWASDEAVIAWRADPGFAERIGRLRQMLDGFEPRTLDPVVVIR